MSSSTRARRKAAGDASAAAEMASVASLPDIIAVCKTTWRTWFRDWDSWEPQRRFFRIFFSLPLEPGDIEFFRQCTGRHEPQPGGYLEAWLLWGRRGGKSFSVSVIAAYLAAYKDWRQYLLPGEVGTIMIVAKDRMQARTIFRHVRSLLKVPELAGLIERETADAIELSNGIAIEIHSAGFGSIRGYTICVLLLDEIGFWPTDEAAEPADMVIAAARPAMATIPNAVLLAASTPFARKGALWNAFDRYWGNPDPVLIWRAPTRLMNPSVTQA
jgi:hypothetical protein